MTTPAAQERAIDRECARISLANLRGIGLATLALASLVTLILRGAVPPVRLASWLIASYALGLLRFCLGLGYARRARTDAELPRWLAAMGASMLFSSALWGTLILVPPELSDPGVTTTIILFTGGLIAAGAQALVGTPTLLGSMWLLNLAPLLARLLASREPAHLPLAVAVLVYLAMVVQFARRNRLVLRESVALRFGNLELVERLRVEKAKAEAARDAALQANHAKNQFLAAASHDIRQPVHAAFLFLGALDNEARASAQLLERLRESLVAARQMLDSLLDLSRLEAGVVERADQNIEAEALLRRLASLFGPVAERSGLTLSLYAPRGLWLRCDPGLCQRVLANLLANALKYTRRGGVLVALRRRAARCLVQVWDTGIGISQPDLACIFDEFKQLNNPERDGSRGIGLGLSIVRRLCRLLGTEIAVRSRPGRGSVFGFELDIGRPSSPDAVAEPGMAPRATARILIVEDNALVREGLAALLHSWGYETSLAANAAEAGRAAGAEHLDLALVDFRLPDEQTGLDAIAAIRRAAQRELPAVIITGDTHPDRILDASKAEHPVLFKPVPPDLLHSTLRKALTNDEQNATGGTTSA